MILCLLKLLRKNIFSKLGPISLTEPVPTLLGLMTQLVKETYTYKGQKVLTLKLSIFPLHRKIYWTWILIIHKTCHIRWENVSMDRLESKASYFAFLISRKLAFWLVKKPKPVICIQIDMFFFGCVLLQRKETGTSVDLLHQYV
jgi:hypothetical protein